MCGGGGGGYAHYIALYGSGYHVIYFSFHSLPNDSLRLGSSRSSIFSLIWNNIVHVLVYLKPMPTCGLNVSWSLIVVYVILYSGLMDYVSLSTDVIYSSTQGCIFVNTASLFPYRSLAITSGP